MSHHHAAPSRDKPVATSDLEAGRELRLGDYSEDPTLSLSEARIILNRTFEIRRSRSKNPEDALKKTETLAKTENYLELFAVFKEMSDAQNVEITLNTYADRLGRFERSQMASLVPTCADEAKAIIPSIEKKVEDNIITEEELDQLCHELVRYKKQAQL